MKLTALFTILFISLFLTGAMNAQQVNSTNGYGGTEFRLGPDDDLFYWPRGKGSAGAIWAVHLDRASMWLEVRGLPDL